MHETVTWGHYGDRLQRVSDFIHTHLGEDLDLDRIAEVACLSPWHWHRVYRQIYGETIASAVRRLRLHHASGDLLKTDLALAEVAKRAGYPNLRSFVRAFREAYGATPAQVRRDGGVGTFAQIVSKGKRNMVEVQIKHLDDLTVVGLPHQGPYMQIGRAFDKLVGELHRLGLKPVDVHAIAATYDDPNLVPADNLRSFACFAIDPDGEVAAPVERRVFKGGDYAVLLHRGPYAELAATFQWVYGVWMPRSGRLRSDAPPYEVYLNDPHSTPPAELLTEIRIPLA